MKLIILNQAKNHHKYLIKNIANFFDIDGIFIERNQLKPTFVTHHSFEDDQDQYEREVLLNNTDIDLSEISKLYECENINDRDVIDNIRKINPDVILTVGTGLIKKELIALCPNGFINLHGGDSEYYRGLDSFLWAIYHEDFSKLVVTLHMLNSKLDDGDIIQKASIKIHDKLEIYKLRAENIKLCLKLTVSSLSSFDIFKEFVSSPQKRKGRYYSFMPAELKHSCIKKYNNYIKTL